MTASSVNTGEVGKPIGTELLGGVDFHRNILALPNAGGTDADIVSNSNSLPVSLLSNAHDNMVLGNNPKRKLGGNSFAKPDVGSSDFEDLWTCATDLTYLTTASTLDVVSASALDIDTSGTGARKVVLTGLDQNYAPIQEIVNLNGTTTVTTTATFLRLLVAQIVDAGSGESPAGIVSITATTGGSDQGCIGQGKPRMATGNGTSAADEIILLHQITLSSPDAGIVEFRVIANGEVGFNRVLLTELEYFVSQTSRPYTIRFDPPLTLMPKWDFKIQAKKDSGGGAVRLSGDYLTSQVDIS